MTEKNMQVFFGKYLQLYPPKETEAYELKISKGSSLPFNAIQEHQIKALLDAEGIGLYHKISDSLPIFGGNDFMRFTAKKPFDCFYLTKIKSYVVVWFYQPRQKKIFIKIPIVKFLEMRNNSNRKSFTESMAKEVGEQIQIYVK